MFERLRSALKKGAEEYRSYPERQCQMADFVRRTNYQRVLNTLDPAAPGTLTIKSVIADPTPEKLPLFIAAIDGMPVEDQYPLLAAILGPHPKLVMVPAMQRWALDNSTALAAFTR